MFDIDTLRIVQATVAVCAFVLVYFGTYRPTRAPYAGWWSATVLISSASSAMYLLGDSDVSRVTDPLGHGLSPVAAAFVWAAARSLRAQRTPWWFLYTPGLIVFIGALVSPRDDGILPGTPLLLVAMAALFALASFELWQVVRAGRGGIDLELAAGTRAAVLFMAAAASIVAVFYTFRIVIYAAVGPTSDFYQAWTGTTTVTFLILIMLVVVTYTVSSLSQLEATSHWRIRALRDDLTGLLGRNAFMERATAAIHEAQDTSARPVVIVADFDHFKTINDAYGHAAGDRMLRAFGQACHRLMSTEGLACRMGGEEFVFLLTDVTTGDAENFTTQLSAAFAEIAGDGPHVPTVSYGIASAERHASLHDTIERADQALYRAKGAGRDQFSVYSTPSD